MLSKFVSQPFVLPTVTVLAHVFVQFVTSVAT